MKTTKKLSMKEISNIALKSLTPEDFIIHETKNGEFILCRVIEGHKNKSDALDALLDILMEDKRELEEIKIEHPLEILF